MEETDTCTLKKKKKEEARLRWLRVQFIMLAAGVPFHPHLPLALFQPYLFFLFHTLLSQEFKAAVTKKKKEHVYESKEADGLAHGEGLLLCLPHRAGVPS